MRLQGKKPAPTTDRLPTDRSETNVQDPVLWCGRPARRFAGRLLAEGVWSAQIGPASGFTVGVLKVNRNALARPEGQRNDSPCNSAAMKCSLVSLAPARPARERDVEPKARQRSRCFPISVSSATEGTQGVGVLLSTSRGRRNAAGVAARSLRASRRAAVAWPSARRPRQFRRASSSVRRLRACRCTAARPGCCPDEGSSR